MFTGILVQIAEFVVGLLVKIFSEKISAYMKEQQVKVADVKAALERRRQIELEAKQSVEKLKQAKTKEEIDAAADDTLNNV